jgi:uncharacterized protein YggE
MKKILLGILLSLFSASLLSAEPLTRQISVTGFCSKEITPDRGRIALTVQYRKLTVKDVVAQTTLVYEKLRGEIKKLNLPDGELQTSEYQVQEVREWEKDKNVFKGYNARMGLLVSSSDIDRLGEVIAIAGKLEVKEVGQLDLYVSNHLLQKEQNSCLSAAASNARDKAQKMAEGLGAVLGAVLTATESSEMPTPPRPQPMFLKAEASRDMAVPTIEPGKKNIQVVVNATFEVK